MTDVGKTQGYTGCECKKQESEVGEDGDDDGIEEEDDMRCVFFKQENLHALGDGRGDSVV